MATLDAAATVIEKRIPLGKDFATIFRVTVTNTGATDEWVTTAITNLSNIKAVFGQALGAALSCLNFVMNDITGTAGTEDTTPGGLGIEAEAAGDILVIVIGRV
jgi:hypothetical protein